MKAVWTAIALLAVTTGQSASAQSKNNFIDPGPAPSDPVAATKQLMETELFDPDSAKYRFLGVHPASCKGGWASGSKPWLGYAATIEINAKNRFGGYTGFTTFTILFNGESAWRSIEGANFGAYGPSKGPLGLGGGANVCRYLD